MRILTDEAMLKLASEDKILLVDRGELIFTDDGGKCSRVSNLCISGEELVCDILMVGARKSLTDAILHQTGQARQDADRRVNRLTIQ